MRLTPEALESLRQAARKQNQDITAFVLGAALEMSERVLAEGDGIQSVQSTV